MIGALSVQVCVMGADSVGETLACRFARAGESVKSIDLAAPPATENPTFDGRGLGIAAGSWALPDDARLWDALCIAPDPIGNIRVIDGLVGHRSSRLHLHFDHREARKAPRHLG